MAEAAVREVEAPVDLLVAVGAVALVADVEGEDGAAVRRGILVEGEDVREEDLVRGGGGAGQVAVAVVVEVVGWEAQEGVDVLAVIEPLVGGVAAVDGFLPLLPRNSRNRDATARSSACLRGAQIRPACKSHRLLGF